MKPKQNFKKYYPWRLKDFILLAIILTAFLFLITAVFIILERTLFIKFNRDIDTELILIYLFLLFFAYIYFFRNFRISISSLFSKLDVKIFLFILLIQISLIVYQVYHLKAYLFLLYLLMELQKKTVFERIFNFDFILNQIVLSTFLAPVVEEIYFRGILQNYLIKLIKPMLAIIFTSFIFTLIHLYDMNLTQKSIINAAILGRFAESLFWGYIYFRTKNLLYSTILHSFKNLSTGIILYVLDSRVLQLFL